MTLDIEKILIGLIVTASWVFLSYGVYRFQTRQILQDGDWADPNSSRRIFWVITGPFFWVLMVCYILAGFGEVAALTVAETWKRWLVNRKLEKHARQRPDHVSMFDPVDE